MTENLRTRILHDLKRISEAVNALIADLDEVPEEVQTKGVHDELDSDK